MRNKLLIILFLIICGSSAFSQITVKANADRTKVGVSENFQVDYVIEAGGGNFTPPSFKDFNVLQNWQQNGLKSDGRNTISTTTFSYSLSPKALGSYTIGPGTLTWNGKSY